MIRTIKALSTAGVLLTLGLGSGLAQTPSYAPAGAQSQGRSGSYNPNEGVQANGCVKLCPLDTNPCDPPEFKRADGRCNLKN